MKKIPRTFRIPADLVERFDQAAVSAGVDRTEIVVKAIRDFVERVEAGKVFNTDKIVVVEELYAPSLGKCDLRNHVLIDRDGNPISKVESPIKVLNWERKALIDGDLVRYDIDQAFATIDFKARRCKISYLVRWIGGLVERRSVEFAIAWSETERDDKLAISIFPV